MSSRERRSASRSRPPHLPAGVDRDRRGPNRPKNGDTSICPRCGTGTIEFSERYRWLDGPIPAWICDNAACGYRLAVRAADAGPSISRPQRR